MYTYIHTYILTIIIRKTKVIVAIIVIVIVIITTVYFRSFIVFLLGPDPGTLKSDIVSKKHPHLICPDLRLSN